MQEQDTTMDGKRRPCAIVAVSRDDEHGLEYVWVHYDGGGSVQFGGLTLDQHMTRVFWQELGTCLGVKADRAEDLLGARGVALHPVPKYDRHYTLEGLESEDGTRRFTILGFQRKHFPDVLKKLGSKPLIDQTKTSVRREIARLHEKIADAEEDLATLDERWTEWDTMPLNTAP